MTKQEEIREGIFRIILDNCWTSESEEASIFGAALRIVDYLHSQGVMLKRESELPDNVCENDDGRDLTTGYKLAQEDMLEAGYVAVKPLIEEPFLE